MIYRTKDGRGVTINSQVRYLRYYEQYLSNLDLYGTSVLTQPKSLRITHFRITPATDILFQRNASISVSVYQGPNQVKASKETLLLHHSSDLLPLNKPPLVKGDTRVSLVGKVGVVPLLSCHFWVHTEFLETSGDER